MSLINDTPTSPDAMEAPMGARNVGYFTDTPVSTMQDIGSIFSTGPLSAIGRSLERSTASQSEYEDIANPWAGPQPIPLSPDEANKKYGPMGPDGKQAKITDQPILDSVAQTIGKQKADEMDRNAVINRFSEQHDSITNLGVGMAGFMMDPLNAASTFIPGVGEETALAGMGRIGLATSGLAARTTARLAAGATVGAISQAPLTALTYGLDQQQASDMDLRSAFKSVMYAAAGNAIFHAGLFGALHETGVLKPDASMRYQDNVKTMPPEAQTVINADAATKHAAMQSAVGQMAEGREVDVDPIFPKQGEAPPTVADVAEKQQEIYRNGYAPGLTGDQLEAAKDEILPEKTAEGPQEKPSRLEQPVIDRYKKTISDEAKRLGIPLDDEALNKAATVMAEGQNPEAQTGKPLTLEQAQSGEKTKTSPLTGTAETQPKKTIIPENIIAAELPKLPRELAGAKSGYKNAVPQFESDVDKALYVVREKSSGKSKSHDKYIDFLKNKVGLSDDEIRQGSEDVLKAVKQHAEGVEGKVNIPKTFTPEQKTTIFQPKRAFQQKSLLDAIQLAASLGGLRDEGGELASMDANKHFVPGRGRLVRQTGQSIDDFGRQLFERGYVKERPTTAETLEIIRDGINGNRTFSEADRSRLEAAGEKNQKSEYIKDLERHASEMGIDTKGMKPEEIEDELRAQTKAAAAEHNFADALKNEPEEVQQKYQPEVSEHANETIPLEAYSEHAGEGPAGEGRPEPETGNETGGAGSPRATGEPDTASTSNSDRVGEQLSPHDAEVAELSSKLDFNSMTGEEKADIGNAAKLADDAQNAYEEKLKAWADCLAGGA